MSSHKTIFSVLLLIILGFIWGSGYSLARYAMTHGVPPLGYAFWQSLGPAIILSLISLSKDGVKIIHRQYWFFFLICGLTGIAIPNTNMYFVAAHIPAGILSVIVNTVPIIVYPLALVAGQEQPDWFRLLAVLMGMCGIVFIINPAVSGGVVSPWSIAALISPCAFALCSLYIAMRSPKSLGPLTSASGMLMAASLLLLPLVIGQHAFYSLSWPWDITQKVVILEMILSSVGYVIFFKLIDIAGPVFYSLTGGMVAITGLFWGYMIFGEQPDLHDMIGISLIIISITTLAYRQYGVWNKDAIT